MSTFYDSVSSSLAQEWKYKSLESQIFSFSKKLPRDSREVFYCLSEEDGIIFKLSELSNRILRGGTFRDPIEGDFTFKLTNTEGQTFDCFAKNENGELTLCFPTKTTLSGGSFGLLLKVIIYRERIDKEPIDALYKQPKGECGHRLAFEYWLLKTIQETFAKQICPLVYFPVANGEKGFVQEYFKQGDLYQVLKEQGDKLSFANRFEICKRLATKLKSLISRGYLPLDLKATNVVMENLEPYLIDFTDIMYLYEPARLPEEGLWGTTAYLDPANIVLFLKAKKELEQAKNNLAHNQNLEHFRLYKIAELNYIEACKIQCAFSCSLLFFRILLGHEPFEVRKGLDEKILKQTTELEKGTNGFRNGLWIVSDYPVKDAGIYLAQQGFNKTIQDAFLKAFGDLNQRYSITELLDFFLSDDFSVENFKAETAEVVVNKQTHVTTTSSS